MELAKGPNTRFVLTIRAAGVATPEIASALIASGAKAPPAVRATAVSGAAPLRARTAPQAQHVRPWPGGPGHPDLPSMTMNAPVIACALGDPRAKLRSLSTTCPHDAGSCINIRRTRCLVDSFLLHLLWFLP